MLASVVVMAIVLLDQRYPFLIIQKGVQGIDIIHEMEERAKAQEEQQKYRLEYRQFLETCGLIKVDTRWWKAQDRLEDDERCSWLEKIDRLEIFQVKESIAYQAVASNTTGSTPKDLFEDVAEELKKKVAALVVSKILMHHCCTSPTPVLDVASV